MNKFFKLSILLFTVYGCTPAQVAQDVTVAEEVLEAGEQIYEGIYNPSTKTIHLHKKPSRNVTAITEQQKTVIKK